MSAPNTDPEKQKEQHRAPLLGMRSVIIWALVLLVLLIVFLTVRGNEPGEDADVGGEATTIEEAQGED